MPNLRKLKLSTCKTFPELFKMVKDHKILKEYHVICSEEAGCSLKQFFNDEDTLNSLSSLT